LDDIGWKILTELQTDARLAFAELGRRVGLSTPAVLERVRKLEDSGVILGYRVVVDAAKVDLPILAFIRISVGGDLLRRMVSLAADLPEVCECHRVVGGDSLILKVNVASIEHLDSLIGQFTPCTSTITSIAVSSIVSQPHFEHCLQAKTHFQGSVIKKRSLGVVDCVVR
jgi:Lrp/AsnC family leucine-responsive transcriptional regulator